jgi:arylsulfatase A-like enzyme
MIDFPRGTVSLTIGRRLALVAAVTVLVAARPACAPSPAPGKPNILLITIDTLRADHLSSYGYERATTPFIDSLAAEGIRFDRAYATSSWTTPSVASMLTSTYQNRHGMGARLRGVPVSWARIPDDLPSLAESLQRDGYRTYGLAANINLAQDRGFERGFDRYKCLGTADLDEVEAALPPYLDVIEGTEGPWSFWLHMLDPHGPYNARVPWIESFEPGYRRYPRLDGMASERFAQRAKELSEQQINVVRALYDSEIRDTDEFLRRRAHDAFVLFTSDHGEEFLDHGGALHGRTLFDESIRIPFIVRLPGRRLAGTVVDRAVSLVDVLPTILGAAGVPPEPGAVGIDLIGHDGIAVPQGRVVVAELLRRLPERATMDGRWKFIVNGGQQGQTQLFDLTRDPRERLNIASRKSAAQHVERFRQLLTAFEQVHAPPVEALEQADITPEQLEALRALGYVGSD